MSKIEDLQTAYEEYQAEKRSYTNVCYEFAAGLRRNFVAYLECSQENLKWFPPSKGFKTDSKVRHSYSHAGAMEMRDDGFWSIGLAVLIDS